MIWWGIGTAVFPCLEWIPQQAGQNNSTVVTQIMFPLRGSVSADDMLQLAFHWALLYNRHLEGRCYTGPSLTLPLVPFGCLKRGRTVSRRGEYIDNEHEPAAAGSTLRLH